MRGTPPAPPIIHHEAVAAPKPGHGEVGAGSDTPKSTRAGINIFKEKRSYLQAGAGLGLALGGAGLAVGLTEGIPAFFGGQGPLASAINPDKPSKDPAADATKKLLSPFGLLAIGAVVLLVVMKK